MFRRKRSKGRREPSTSSASSAETGTDDGNSSIESYCRYNKSDRRKRDGRRCVGKEKSNGKGDRKSSLKKGKKSVAAGDNVRTESSGDGSNSTITTKKTVKNPEKIQQKEKPLPNNIVEQQVTVDAKPNEQNAKEKLPEFRIEKMNESVLMHEAPTINESELSVAAPTKQDSVDKPIPTIVAGESVPNDKTIVTVADVHSPTAAEVDAAIESAQKIVADVELAASKLVDESASTEKNDEIGKNVENETATTTTPTTTVMVTDETPVTQSGENVAQPVDGNANDEIPSKQNENAGNENEKVETVGDNSGTKEVKFDEKSIEKAAGDSENADAEQSQPMDVDANATTEMKNNVPTSKSEAGDAVAATAAATATATAAATNATKTDDASKSFQVLPVGGETTTNTNTNNQGNEDAGGGLMPPKAPTETIRKTSFTVLKSDESMDDILGVVDENKNASVKTAKTTLPRPKSFKVLGAMDASGEDILLQPSSDQEKSGNEGDDDYLNGNALADQRSGKYSDSELIKFDGNANGRRKKYKKRAKSSMRQLSIANDPTGDGSNQSLNKQQSRDQDSGFEPSPRAMRTIIKPSTKSIYTAPLPERPRVGDVIDSRSCSSRFEQRKPGDKNAVNMSTVSQTLQRNIRRLSHSHIGIFAFLHFFFRFFCFALLISVCVFVSRLLQPADITWNTKYFNICWN